MRLYQTGLVILLLVLSVATSSAEALDDAIAGRKAISQGENDKGINLLTKAIKSDWLSKINVAKAYNNRGVGYKNKALYDLSIEDYSKAIELKPGYALAYKNRGNAYFYQAKFSNAEIDFKELLKLKPESSYSIIFLYLSLIRAGKEGKAELLSLSENIDLSEWPGHIISMYSGNLTPEKVIESTVDQNEEVEKMKKCEAYFYLGQYYLVNSENEKAIDMFKQSLDTGVTAFFEYHGAKAELARMGLLPKEFN